MFGYVRGHDHDQKHTYVFRSKLLYFQSGALSTVTDVSACQRCKLSTFKLSKYKIGPINYFQEKLEKDC